MRVSTCTPVRVKKQSAVPKWYKHYCDLYSYLLLLGNKEVSQLETLLQQQKARLEKSRLALLKGHLQFCSVLHCEAIFILSAGKVIK